MSEEVEEIKLTGKQRLFADYYVGEANLNATKAAIRAGYSEKTARMIGYENLTKPYIWDYIEKRLDEISLKQKEVAANFTLYAKGSISDILEKNGEFDYVQMCERGADKLLKKYKTKTVHKYDPTTKETSTEITQEFEMYDALAANAHMAKINGQFIERTDITSKGEAMQTLLVLPKVDDSAT